jgi:high affinity sulfate transporter 1
MDSRERDDDRVPSPPPGAPWRWLPGLYTLTHYRRRWLGRDVLAGIVLTAVLIPVGMGYAQAAGLPAITGLYATIVPLAAYALTGPSRILVLGPDSSLAPLIAAVVLPLAAGDPERALALAGMLAILTGAYCAAAGLGRVGFVTDLLSVPIRYGYLDGIALTVIVGQLPALFGFSTDAEGLLPETWAFVGGVVDGETVPAALAIGVAALAVIFLMRRSAPRIPGVLLAAVLGIVAVSAFSLADQVEVVGVLPQGLPTFVLPRVALSDLWDLAIGALGISLIALADTSVLSRTLAGRERRDVDPNQELMALGAANAAAGLFQGFPISSSASRTPVAVSAGARTQLAPLVGALAIALMLLFAPGLVRNLPQAALAAIVIAAATTLIEFRSVLRLLRIRRSEFYLFLGAFLSVALLGVLRGIFVSILLALGNFIRRAWRPHDALLGRVDDLKGYHDLERFPRARTIPGLLLYRFDAPLFFANAATFRRRLLEVRAAEPELRWIVVAAEAMTDVDVTAGSVLRELLDELGSTGVTLAFAELKDPVRDRLRRYGLEERIGVDRFFPTLGTAVDAYVRVSGVDWVDWEERRRGT